MTKIHEIIVPNGKKLGDELDFLPSGIIDKRATGIGATHCEIIAQRHSIIVVPTKALAYSKASQHKEILYVGSDFKKIKSPSDREIQEYDQKSPPKYKKIVVVADSFPRVISAIGDTIYKKYFLMVDEIDSFQQDSTFRSAMEDCIDYYFHFDERCLVSSTLMDFSNKKIKKEGKTIIRYKDNPEKQRLEVHRTNNRIHHAASTITKIHKENPEDKVLIAFASVTAIMEIVEYLKPEIQSEVCVLCGGGSKSDVGEYYNTLSENGKLPSGICFMTSAYFAGLDIYEKYHAVVVSDHYPQHAALTKQQITQILGRGRIGHHTRTVIIPDKKVSKTPLSNYRENLIKAAKNFCKMDDCLEKYFDEDISETTKRRNIKELLISEINSVYSQLTRLNSIESIEKMVPAYFNIDAEYNWIKNRNTLYASKDGVNRELRESYRLKNFSPPDHPRRKKGKAAGKKILKNKSQAVGEAISEIEELGPELNYRALEKEATGKERETISYYGHLKEYVEHEEAIRLIKEYYQDEKDSRKIDGVIKWCKLWKKDSESYIGDKLKMRFPIDKVFSGEEVFNELGKMFKTQGLHKDQSDLSKRNAVQRLNKLVETKPRKIKGKPNQYEITGYNPYNISLKEDGGS